VRTVSVRTVFIKLSAARGTYSMCGSLCSPLQRYRFRLFYVIPGT